MNWCPFLKKAGPIWALRLMTDPLSGQSRGSAFITFKGKEAAQEAGEPCGSYGIRLANTLSVHFKRQTTGFFAGSIPKNKTKENILEEPSKVTEGLVDVILHHQPDDKRRVSSALSMRTTSQQHQPDASADEWKVEVWGNAVPAGWADPAQEPGSQLMAWTLRRSQIQKSRPCESFHL